MFSFTHDFFHDSSLKSRLEHHIGWSYKVLLTCATGTGKTAWRLVQRQPRHQPLIRKWSLVWHQWVVSCNGDLQAVEDLDKGPVLLWRLSALGLSFLGSCVKGYGWSCCPHQGCSSHAMANARKAKALGQQWRANSRNLILNSLHAPVQRFEGCTLVLKQCSEIRGMVKCASSSHLDRGL